MLQPARQYYTPEEYLWLEARAIYKSEYFDGEIYAMAGGSPNHGQVAVNIIGELHSLFKGKTCRVLNSDSRVGVQSNRFYTYPDVSVVCGSLEFVEGRTDTIINPIVIIEVLSPSTRSYDRGLKFERYRAISSLQAYVVIDSERIFIEFFRKIEDGNWLLETLTEFTSNLKLKMVEAELPLSAIYDKVEFENQS